MRRNRVYTLCLYIAFAIFLVLAFVLSWWITDEKDKISVPKENFTVMMEKKEISALYYDGANVWVGCNDGVYVYDADTEEQIQCLEEFNLVYSAEITQSPDKTVWIGHEDGLTGIRKNDEKNRVEFKYPDIPKGRINTVEWDGERLWVGTYNGGASLIQKEDGWQVESIFDRRNGLCSDSVNVICSTDESIWFGSYLDTKNGGISICENNEIWHLTEADGLPHPYVTSLQYLGNGKMLAGTGYMDDGGLALIQKNGKTYEITKTYSVEEGLPGQKIRHLYLDQEGYIWITTEYDGVVIIKPKGDELIQGCDRIYLTEKNGLSDNEIKCIVETPRGYWLGGKYGLTIIEHSFVKDKLQ